MRDSFIFYKSFYEGIKELTTEQQAEVVLSILKYQFEEDFSEELTGVSKCIFSLIKPQLDANNAKYENGCKGGAPKGNQNAKKENNQKTTEKQRNENENVNENEKDIKKESKKEKINYEEILKEFSLSKELEDTFRDFIQMRTFIKKPLTNQGLKLAVKKVLSMSSMEKERIEIVEQSVMNNWLGIFPLKKDIPALQGKKADEAEEIAKLRRQAAEEWGLC